MALLSRWLGAVLAESGQLVLAAQRAEPVAKTVSMAGMAVVSRLVDLAAGHC
uniref:hypothetical protein n=1 Tax=Kluyvera ascorbata TaxID=51288 RepID=UPI0015F1189C|nr:hypothetical protein [Kluyvera ascorbata]